MSVMRSVPLSALPVDLDDRRTWSVTEYIPDRLEDYYVRVCGNCEELTTDAPTYRLTDAPITDAPTHPDSIDSYWLLKYCGQHCLWLIGASRFSTGH